MRAHYNELPADFGAPNRNTTPSMSNAWVWTRLTDEHLEVCLEDFVWLSQFGDRDTRPACSRTRDQISAECVRRGRLDIQKRAWLRGLNSH